MEIWKYIEDYGLRYQVSNYGRVRSLSRQGKSREFVLKPVLNARYHKVSLCTPGVAGHKIISIHRLVAKYFLPDWDSSLQVNHIDGDKFNNHSTNLEMVTAKENTAHAELTGLRNNKGVHNNRSRFTAEDVSMIRWYFHCCNYTRKQLAIKYSCHADTIGLLLRYKHYCYG